MPLRCGIRDPSLGAAEAPPLGRPFHRGNMDTSVVASWFLLLVWPSVFLMGGRGPSWGYRAPAVVVTNPPSPVVVAKTPAWT